MTVMEFLVERREFTARKCEEFGRLPMPHIIILGEGDERILIPIPPEALETDSSFREFHRYLVMETLRVQGKAALMIASAYHYSFDMGTEDDRALHQALQAGTIDMQHLGTEKLVAVMWSAEGVICHHAAITREDGQVKIDREWLEDDWMDEGKGSRLSLDLPFE